jgi:hypothetical protein
VRISASSVRPWTFSPQSPFSAPLATHLMPQPIYIDVADKLLSDRVVFGRLPL